MPIVNSNLLSKKMVDFEEKFLDPVDIQLLECVISDPCIHVDAENLPNFEESFSAMANLSRWQFTKSSFFEGWEIQRVAILR